MARILRMKPPKDDALMVNFGCKDCAEKYFDEVGGLRCRLSGLLGHLPKNAPNECKGFTLAPKDTETEHY